MNLFTFLFKAMKETHEQRKTKIDIDEFRSRTTNITPPNANSAEETQKHSVILQRKIWIVCIF